MAGYIPGVELGKRYKVSLAATQTIPDVSTSICASQSSSSSSSPSSLAAALVPDIPSDLVSLQYRFKPPVDESEDGRISIDKASGRWNVIFKAGTSSSGMRADHINQHFQGAPTKGTMEHILVWRPHPDNHIDDQGRAQGEFVIERVKQSVQLAHKSFDNLDENIRSSFSSSSSSSSSTFSASTSAINIRLKTQAADIGREARSTEARFQEMMGKGKSSTKNKLPLTIGSNSNSDTGGKGTGTGRGIERTKETKGVCCFKEREKDEKEKEKEEKRKRPTEPDSSSSSEAEAEAEAEEEVEKDHQLGTKKNNKKKKIEEEKDSDSEDLFG